MDILLNTTVWLCLGIMLIVAELIVPGGVIVFLGGGCLIVAGAIWLGLVDSGVTAMSLFFFASLALIIVLRSFFMRFAEGDYSVANTVELLDELGAVVEVVDTIGPGQQAGRIMYRDTAWNALGGGEEIKAGEQVRIVSRENVNYLVERL